MGQVNAYSLSTRHLPKAGYPYRLVGPNKPWQATSSQVSHQFCESAKSKKINYRVEPFRHPRVKRLQLEPIINAGNFIVHDDGEFYLLPWKEAGQEKQLLLDAINNLADKLVEEIGKLEARRITSRLTAPTAPSDQAMENHSFPKPGVKVMVDSVSWGNIGELCLHSYPTVQTAPYGCLLKDYRLTCTHQLENNCRIHLQCLKFYEKGQQEELLISLKRLFLMPRALLHTGPRSEGEMCIMEEVSSILRDDWSSIGIYMAEKKAEQAGSKKMSQEDLNKRKAMELLADGQISKSFQALGHRKRVFLTDEVVCHIRDLHPESLHGDLVESNYKTNREEDQVGEFCGFLGLQEYSQGCKSWYLRSPRRIFQGDDGKEGRR
jgi:hypothetical protein